MLIRPLPATETEARSNLMELRRQRREVYADLSELLGEDEGYLAGWLYRENPAILPEHHKRDLARYFNVEPQAFGVPFDEVEPRPAFVKPPLREMAAR